jgi:thiaminase
MLSFRRELHNRFLPTLKSIIQLPFNQKMITEQQNSIYHQRFLLFLHLDADVFLPRFGETLWDVSQQYAHLNRPVESHNFALLAQKNFSYIESIYRQYPAAKYCKAANHPFFNTKPDKLHEDFARYCQHLVKPAPVSEQVAKITACIWLYDQLGKGLPIHTCTKDNPYLPWLYGYRDSSSMRTTNYLINTLEQEYSNEQCSIKQEAIFLEIEKSLQLEFAIFDSAYTQESVAKYAKVL